MAIQEQEEEEVVTMNLGLNNNNDLSYIAKGKRTKRQRPQSPIIIAMNTSLSTRNDDEEKHQTSVSPTSSSIGFTVTDSTEEEEDMANCLILLAKGHNFQNSKQERRNGGVSMEKFNSSSKRFSEIAGGDSSKSSGFFVYECKTCNRCFSSFQALGGHRASHKRPKNMVDQTQVDKKSLVLAKDDQINNQVVQFSNNQTQIVNTHLQISNVRTSIGSNKSKVHECSICGSEFSSGQALGGHMRRHRTTTTTTTTNTSSNHNDSNSVIVTSSESEGQKKSRHILSLDLNLPAPEDDREGKFNFGSKQSLVFSATSLVDCHY